MKRIIMIFSVVCLLTTGLVLLQAADARAQEAMLEELEMIYGAELIVTASKREQKISDSPVAVTVITQEDIRKTGATQLCEVLNMYAGIHFGYTTSSFPLAGGIRGFHKLPANKIVLLVNGIPQMFEVYGIPALTLLPVSLDDIERIEVLRGPGSSLYGANAMLGVINVITRKPEESQGSQISLKAGNNSFLQGTFSTGGEVIPQDLFYRVSVSWDQMDNWDKTIAYYNDPALEAQKLSTEWSYYMGDNQRVDLLASYLNLDDFYALIDSTGPISFTGGEAYNAQFAWAIDEPNVTVKGFYNYRDLWDTGYARGARGYYFKMYTRGAEVQQTLEPFENDVFLWGANYQQVSTEGAIVGGDRRHDFSGLFVDNTYDFTDELAMNIGLRFDHGPNTDDTLAHRLAFIYEPVQNHVFRFSWSTAFRNPDFIETYYSATMAAPVGGVIVPGVFALSGDESNKAEKAENLEIGYRGLLGKLQLTTNLFYTEIEDMIVFSQTSTSLLPPYVFKHINLPKVQEYGAEIEVEYPLLDWLTIMANYTWYDMQEDTISKATREFVGMTPKQLINAQLRAEWENGLSANLMAEYTDASQWSRTALQSWGGYPADPDGITTKAGGKADSYLIAHLRVAYEFLLGDNDAEIALVVRNLTDKGYDDYPLSSADIGRTIYGSFRYSF